MMSHLPVAKKHFVEFRYDLHGSWRSLENQSRGMLCPFSSLHKTRSKENTMVAAYVQILQAALTARAVRG